MLSPVAWALVGLFVLLCFAAIVVRNTRRETARRRQIEQWRYGFQARQEVMRQHQHKRREERRREHSDD